MNSSELGSDWIKLTKKLNGLTVKVTTWISKMEKHIETTKNVYELFIAIFLFPFRAHLFGIEFLLINGEMRP